MVPDITIGWSLFRQGHRLSFTFKPAQVEPGAYPSIGSVVRFLMSW